MHGPKSSRARSQTQPQPSQIAASTRALVAGLPACTKTRKSAVSNTHCLLSQAGNRALHALTSLQNRIRGRELTKAFMLKLLLRCIADFGIRRVKDCRDRSSNARDQPQQGVGPLFHKDSYTHSAAAACARLQLSERDGARGWTWTWGVGTGGVGKEKGMNF